MKRALYYYDDEMLRRRALPVDVITPEIVQLAEDMIETMIASNGVGLAAPQVGKLLRLFIIRNEVVGPDGKPMLGPPEVIINPVLSKPSEEKIPMQEGCLSLPGLYVDVVRPKAIHVRYQNLKGEWIEELLDDFRARVTMHENDHLNGVLIIDRISKDERKKIEPHLKQIKVKYSTA